MQVTIYEQQCNNCYHVWTFRTDNHIGQPNSQTCPICNESNSTLISMNHVEK